MNMKHIYFRANFNTETGMGHFMRVNRIANYFNKKGFSCNIFLDKKNVEKQISNKIKHKIIYLYKNSSNKYNQIDDAKKTISLMKKDSIIFIDDYRAKLIWQNELKNKGFKSVKISDFVNDRNCSDYIINTKLDFLEKKVVNNYKNLNPKSYLMLGPKYCMIDNKYKVSAEKKEKFKIAFYLGGSGDAKILRDIIISLINNINLKNFYFYVIVGPFSKNVKYLNDLESYKQNIKIIKNNLNLFKIINHIDLFIGSAGISIFETSLYKIPSIFFKISKNQNINRSMLGKIGQYFVLEKRHLIQKKKISKLICLIYQNYKKIKSEVQKSDLNIDDKGVKRIFKTIIRKIKSKDDINLISKKIKFYYSKTQLKDINLYVNTRNKTHNFSISNYQKKIDILDHYIWWFSNNRESYTVYKKGEPFLFFYHDTHFINDKKIVVPGWMSIENKPNFILVLKSTLIHYDLLKKIKNKITIGFIGKQNHAMLKFANKLNWKKFDKSNKLYYQMKKKFNFSSNAQTFIR